MIPLKLLTCEQPNNVTLCVVRQIGKPLAMKASSSSVVFIMANPRLLYLLNKCSALDYDLPLPLYSRNTQPSSRKADFLTGTEIDLLFHFLRLSFCR